MRGVCIPQTRLELPAGKGGHGLFVVLFVLYIIVVAVVEFHLDTTNTPLISHHFSCLAHGRTCAADRTRPRWQWPCVLSPTRRFSNALADVPSPGCHRVLARKQEQLFA